MAVGEAFGHIEPPDDWRRTVYVVRITSSGVERHAVELTESGPNMLTPIGDRIWTNFPALGGLCWWAGDHFERGTQEEARMLGGIEHFYHLDTRAYRDERGWSKDVVRPEQTLVINLGDGTEVSAYGGTTRVPLSIELRKQGGEPSTAFNVDTGAGRVSRNAYQHAFQDPQ